MATAKKLPSGSWRCLVFSHYEYVTEKDGNIKKKRMKGQIFARSGSLSFFTGSEGSGISHFYRKCDFLYYNYIQCDNITYIT